MDYPELILSISIGIGLAAAVGFRVFLPLLVLSVAGHYNIIPLNESWQWAGSLAAVITLGVATIVEVFGYYIPWVDTILDTIAVPLAAAAGTAVMAATVTDMSPVFTWALAIIAGGGTATFVQGNTTAARLTSTATTGGLANPIFTTVETGTSVVLSILSIVFPFVAVVLVLLIFYFIFKFYKKLQKKRQSTT